MSTQHNLRPEEYVGALPVNEEDQMPLMGPLDAGAVSQALQERRSIPPDREVTIAKLVLDKILLDLADRSVDGRYYVLHGTELAGVVHAAVRQGYSQAAVDIAVLLERGQAEATVLHLFATPSQPEEVLET